MRFVCLTVLLLAACARPHKLELVDAPPDGAVHDIVQRELKRAHRDGRQLLVYEGATWCEPCRRFHAAAESGALDDRFPTLRLLVFDADRDKARLDLDGYRSTYIPLFARPGDDGHASGRQIEGSIKGDGAVAQIAPRLEDLITPP